MKQGPNFSSRGVSHSYELGHGMVSSKKNNVLWCRRGMNLWSWRETRTQDCVSQSQASFKTNGSAFVIMCMGIWCVVVCEHACVCTSMPVCTTTWYVYTHAHMQNRKLHRNALNINSVMLMVEKL